MLIERVLSSWAGHKTIEGFPLLPKQLPTEESYNQGSNVKEIRWLRRVTFARVVRSGNQDSGDLEWTDAYWVDKHKTVFD